MIGAAEGFGAFPSEVSFVGVRSGRVRDVRLANSCGTAEYGVNVFASGRIVISDSKATGFTDAGFYIGGIVDTAAGALVVRDNVATGNNRGVIVEDSAGGAIEVVDNLLKRNRHPGEGIRSGIFVHNSDGVRIAGNRTINSGVYGIHLDGGSDRNRLFDNVSERSGTADFLDEGSGNCGARNSFPLPRC